MEIRAVFVTKSGGSKTPLGNLAPTPVIFNVDGLSGFVSFRCLSGLGTTVRAKNILWRWQFRTTPGGAWTDIAETRHRIYVLLDVPTAPWQQTPYNAANVQLPWTDVLDIACVWAANATTKELLYRGGPALRRLPAGRRRPRPARRRSALPDAAEEHGVRSERTGAVSRPPGHGGRTAQVQPRAATRKRRPVF